MDMSAETTEYCFKCVVVGLVNTMHIERNHTCIIDNVFLQIHMDTWEAL